MTKVEWKDVQSLVVTGYPKLRKAAYILWQFTPGQKGQAKLWLRKLANRVTVATPRGAEPTDKAINVALSASALATLGIDRSGFSTEFLEGIAPSPPTSSPTRCARRSSQLGDLGINDPINWRWGGWQRGPEVHGVLLLYARCNETLDSLLAEELWRMRRAATLARCAATGAPLILKAYLRSDRREHFGFCDGISQPIIEGTKDAEGLSSKQARFDVIKPGEFVIGYRGERDPRWTGTDPAGSLQRNGTYLVFRDLEQDVDAFDNFLTRTAQKVLGSDKASAREWVAARLIGRWRSGQPLVSSAFADCNKATSSERRNDFLYHYEDRYGLACPIGAHIRRANPRDSLSTDPDTALRLSRMHRIIRRGRLYGPHMAVNGARGTQTRRGIYFICLNADIAGQFELIQHSWLNNMHVGGLYDERDPLNSNSGGGTFTIQQRPTNLRLRGIPQFVTVRGGAYFFMPGITALREMAG